MKEKWSQQTSGWVKASETAMLAKHKVLWSWITAWISNIQDFFFRCLPEIHKILEFVSTEFFILKRTLKDIVLEDTVFQILYFYYLASIFRWVLLVETLLYMPLYKIHTLHLYLVVWVKIQHISSSYSYCYILTKIVKYIFRKRDILNLFLILGSCNGIIHISE